MTQPVPFGQLVIKRQGPRAVPLGLFRPPVRFRIHSGIRSCLSFISITFHVHRLFSIFFLLLLILDRGWALFYFILLPHLFHLSLFCPFLFWFWFLVLVLVLI